MLGHLVKTSDMNRFPLLKVGQAILLGSNLNLNFALTLKLPINGVIPKLDLENGMRKKRVMIFGHKISFYQSKKWNNSFLQKPKLLT